MKLGQGKVKMVGGYGGEGRPSRFVYIKLLKGPHKNLCTRPKSNINGSNQLKYGSVNKWVQSCLYKSRSVCTELKSRCNFVSKAIFLALWTLLIHNFQKIMGYTCADPSNPYFLGISRMRSRFCPDSAELNRLTLSRLVMSFSRLVECSRLTFHS